MLNAGDPAPDFDLRGTDGSGVGAYRLSAATSQAPVLLAFYPENFAPPCTAYLEGLRDTDWASLTDGIAVFGVAPGEIESHRNFATELDLPFPLLADHAGIDGQFGLQRPDGSTQRAAVLVDRDCRVSDAWVVDDPTAGVRQVRAAVDRL